MTDPHTTDTRRKRSIAFLLALGLPLTAVTTLAVPTAAAAAESAPPKASASEVEAFDVAAKTGQRVEILDRREETAEVFANPDGTTTRRQYSTPVWSRYEGVWKKADATIVRHGDGTIGPASPSFGITFSGGGTLPLATLTKGDKKLALSWPTALPEPAVEKNTALYRSVLPGVDLKVIAEVDGFAEHLIVNTPEAAANPGLKSIKLGITADGVTIDDDASDNLIAKDAAGTIIFSAPTPKMWEQPPAEAAPAVAKAKVSASAAETSGEAEPPQTAPVGADITGGTLTLTPDPALLASADQFPLVIDPPFTGGYREKWAVVYSDTPSDAYPNGSGWHSGTPTDEPRVGYNGTGTTRSFFAMNTNGLEQADILDATFAVVETHSWGCSASEAGPTELWATDSITTTPTWNNNGSLWAYKLDADSFAHGNPTYCPGDQGHDFKSTALTDYVRKAADNSWGTLTFGLRAASGYESNVNSFKRFRNSPALEVTYNYKPTLSAAAAFEGGWSPGGDGNKPVPCGDVIGNSGLALTAKLSDKDGGTITPQFSVTNASGAAVPVTNGAAVASGRTATGTVAAKNLPSGAYKWKVRAKDGEGTYSAYTTDCAFTVDQQGPIEPVTVTTANGTPATDATYPARSASQLTVYNSANDVAGFCWAMDHFISVSSTRCSNGTWVPVGPDKHTATINAIPTGYPNSTLYVVAFDQADNHSPLDGGADAVTLKTTKSPFVYGPGQDPGKGLAREDRHGDLTGDGHSDFVATADDGRLLLYAGDGTGQVATASKVGTAGWSGALIAHGGDFANFTSPTQAPDGYEDFLVRLSDGKLYLYPGNGRGEPWVWTRQELEHAALNSGQDWTRTRQIITPGDIDKNETEGHAGGRDMITIECTTDGCADGQLWLYTGNTVSDGTANQAEPFDLINRVKIGTSGWKDYTNLAVGDQNGDGVKDIVARDPATDKLYLYPGQVTNGAFSLGSRTEYGSGYWRPATRPHLTSPGNVQGTVSTATYTDPDTGEPVTYRQFQPTAGEAYGDLWATTPADPNFSVGYLDAAGTWKTTTCATGCLLFYPGGPTTHRQPRLAGTSNWDTTITGIF